MQSFLVKFDFDNDGYISGWSQAFFDGYMWQTPFDTTNAVEMTQADLDGISLGATKLTDGKLVVDDDKLAEITAKANQTTPTPEQLMINSLGLQVAALQAKLAKVGDGTSV